MIHQLIPLLMWKEIYLEIQEVQTEHQRVPTYLKSILSILKYIINEIVPLSILEKAMLALVILAIIPILVLYYLFICYKVRAYFHTYPEELI